MPCRVTVFMEFGENAQSQDESKKYVEQFFYKKFQSFKQ